MSLKISVIAITTFLLFSNLVLAFPIGHQFFGTVTINGNLAPDGTTVTAEINGVEYTDTTTNDGNYDFKVSVDSVNSGKTIYFYVDSVQANENYQFCFEQACSTRLDLTVVIESSTPPAGGGGGGAVPSTTSTTGTTGTTETTSTTTETGCQERWTCSEWGECVNGIQARTCQDENACGTNSREPFASQPCTTVGVEEASIGGSLGFFLLSTTDLAVAVTVGAVAAAAIIFLVMRRKPEPVPVVVVG